MANIKAFGSKHPTRKHGVKFDEYYSIHYQRDGKRREEGLGWATEGWQQLNGGAS